MKDESMKLAGLLVCDLECATAIATVKVESGMTHTTFDKAHSPACLDRRLRVQLARMEAWSGARAAEYGHQEDLTIALNAANECLAIFDARFGLGEK